MHVGSAIAGALQMSIDNVLFSTRLLSDKRTLLWDIPNNSSKVVCIDHGIFNPHYTIFPPPHWRDFITRRLNMLVGFVPSPARPCLTREPNVRVGVYYRSGTRDINQLRRVCNLDALLADLGGLVGPTNVAAFTTNESMSLLAQIQRFDAHDILVGPHGSHWDVSWFAERPRVIVEIQAAFAAVDQRRAITSKGPAHFFLVSAGHEFYSNDCRGGVEAGLAAHARRLCAPQNFDGSSPLCSGGPNGPPTCAITPCEPGASSGDRGLVAAFKQQSTRVNVTAVAAHVAVAVGLLGLVPCAA